ncbi:hypothetical protein [Clostridium sp. ZBS13]|uniref:hypothetical protein n=1 Tax=Clostridium sp. ZBS13 TaxID=2949971 RepID=UPI00207A2456|nr:hypothetical protein [Clostridium sp. ZBS13]
MGLAIENAVPHNAEIISKTPSNLLPIYNNMPRISNNGVIPNTVAITYSNPFLINEGGAGAKKIFNELDSKVNENVIDYDYKIHKKKFKMVTIGTIGSAVAVKLERLLLILMNKMVFYLK